MALSLGLLTSLPFRDVASEYLISPASSAVYGSAVTIDLELWHGITPMLILSIITVAAGVGLYLILNRVVPALDAIDLGQRLGPENLFQRMIDELPHFAKSLTQIFQSGYLRSYILMIISTFVALVGYVLFTQVALPSLSAIQDVYFFEVVLAIVILLAIVLVIRSEKLLYTIASLGVIGYSIALIFILYGAPDLAMTQFSIETLSVVLFVLVLYRLPALIQISPLRVRLRDGAVALAAGGLMTTIVLAVASEPLNSKLTAFFAEASYPLAHGRNIVNVILVDFRGFDTLGEITVLAVASIGVYSLLKLRIEDSPQDDTETYSKMASVEEFKEQEKEQKS
jgi:multicomponent Na+:H+ antiporter subunit A